MSLVAPQHFELSYLRYERRWRDTLSRLNSWAIVLPAVFTMLILSFNLFVVREQSGVVRALNGTRNLELFNRSLLFLIPIAGAGMLCRAAGWRKLVLILSSLIAWGCFAHEILKLDSYAASAFAYVTFVPLLLAIFFALDQNKERLTRITRLGIFAALFWSMYGGLYLWEATPSPASSLFFDLKLTFLFIFLSIALVSEARTRWEMILNPAHMTRGTIWPDSYAWSQDEAEARVLFAHGSLNLLLAAILMTARFWFELTQVQTGAQDISQISKILLLRLLTDVALFNVITGLARSFGFAVPDATYFVCLAKTPAEFWRRGSTYTYQFVLRYIYLPLYRSTRNQKLALFAGFSFFFFNRIGLNGITVSLRENRFEVRVAVAVFLLYFLSIVISQRVWFVPKRKMDEPALAWLSIALTHATNVAIVFVARLLAEKFA